MKLISPELLSAYNRPIRSLIWVFVIMLHTILTGVVHISQDLLFLMFADLGVNSVARTVEKVKKMPYVPVVDNDPIINAPVASLDATQAIITAPVEFDPVADFNTDKLDHNETDN